METIFCGAVTTSTEENRDNKENVEHIGSS